MNEKRRWAGLSQEDRKRTRTAGSAGGMLEQMCGICVTPSATGTQSEFSIGELVSRADTEGGQQFPSKKGGLRGGRSCLFPGQAGIRKPFMQWILRKLCREPFKSSGN